MADIERVNEYERSFNLMVFHFNSFIDSIVMCYWQIATLQMKELFVITEEDFYLDYQYIYNNNSNLEIKFNNMV